MAQVAYDLKHFETVNKPAPPVRVAKRVNRQRSAQSAQILKMMRILGGVLVLVALVCAVLYTQTAVTEVTTQIATQKQELKEEESLYTYLSFELDNKTSLKNIEDSAANMGLKKVGSDQIRYFRVEDGNEITVKENFFQSIWSRLQAGLQGVLGQLSP